MLNITGWVRGMFREAAMSGISDAMAVIATPGETPPATLDDLRKQFADASSAGLRALPVASDDGEGETTPAAAKKGRGR